MMTHLLVLTLLTASVIVPPITGSKYLATAWKEIMEGTTTLESIPAFKLYQKRGGYPQALKDFEALKPNNVQLSRWSKRGKVGSIDVYLEVLPPARLILLDKTKSIRERVIFYDKVQ